MYFSVISGSLVWPQVHSDLAAKSFPRGSLEPFQSIQALKKDVKIKKAQQN
jgi:hypothetical protein